MYNNSRGFLGIAKDEGYKIFYPLCNAYALGDAGNEDAFITFTVAFIILALIIAMIGAVTLVISSRFN